MDNIPDILKAIYYYIEKFTSITGNNIFRAYPNKATLPRKTNIFAVMTLIPGTRVGTNVEKMQSDAEILNVKTLVEYQIQIDIYGNNQQETIQNAQKLNAFWRSQIAVDFLKDYEVIPLFADNGQDLSEADGSDQYVFRYTRIFHAQIWEEFETEQESFSSANINLVNVDVAYEVIDE